MKHTSWKPAPTIHFTDRPFRFVIKGMLYRERIYAYCSDLESAEQTREAWLKNGGEAVVIELPIDYVHTFLS